MLAVVLAASFAIKFRVAVLHSLIIFGTQIVAPFLFLWLKVNVWKTADWDLTDRTSRRDIFLFASFAMFFSLVPISFFGYGDLLVWEIFLSVAILAGTIITFAWKISVHSAINTLTILVLSELFSSWFLLLAPIIIVVYWS